MGHSGEKMKQMFIHNGQLKVITANQTVMTEINKSIKIGYSFIMCICLNKILPATTPVLFKSTL